MRRQLFSLVLLVTLGLVAFIGVVLVQPDLLGALAGREAAGHVSHHFREPHHRVHDLAFSFLLGTTVVGTLMQLRGPSRNAASQVMALIPIASLALATALTNTAVLSFPWLSVGALVLIGTVLHPAVGDLQRSIALSRVDRVRLGLTAIAAVPLLAFAYNNLELQRRGLGEHAELGHYGFMAAFGFTVVAMGVFSSMSPEGWRLTAWVAGSLPASLGLASLLFPDVESSLEALWAILAIVWGIAYVARAELSRRGGATLTTSG